MKEPGKNSSLLAVLNRRFVWPPPIWLMRQAGRYLPEYQAIRKKAGSFWAMCMSPDLAVEVTLQPIRRFDFDAAILFSDILVVPYALGQPVRFEDGRGPVLGPFENVDRLVFDEAVWREKLAPVYAAIRQTKVGLPCGKALIGFAGAPWTLAAYMLEGGGSPDQRAAKLFAYGKPEEFGKLLAVLTEAVAWHLSRQLDAGADIVQIFDSWAGGLPAAEFADWVVQPTAKIVTALRRRFPDARIIGFPRAATQVGYESYAARTGVDAVGIDTATSLDWAVSTLSPHVVLQGNLDPIALVAGGDALDRAVDRILLAAKATPFIFNLGHGVLPETPLEHVVQLLGRVRSWQ